MDGHGTKGHVVTCFFKQELPKILKENLLLMNDSDDRVRNQQDDDVSLQQWEEKLVTLAKVVRVPTINSRNNDIHRVLVKTFHLSHVRAIENPNIPAGCSGTTCIVCVLDKNLKRLHVASVGDSRAILWNNTSDGVLVLAEETTTKLSTELDRIQQCEGRVDTGASIVFYGRCEGNCRQCTLSRRERFATCGRHSCRMCQAKVARRLAD
jgi:serine/threonine protein phosphatase PrpC